MSAPGPTPRRPRTRLGWALAGLAALTLALAGVFLVLRYGAQTAQGRVFIEGRLDRLDLGRIGRLRVEGVSGVWKGLTDNVNQLAATLTTQLRAISEVSQAVTQGDLTRSIAVEAEGEVAELKDKIHQMIENGANAKISRMIASIRAFRSSRSSGMAAISNSRNSGRGFGSIDGPNTARSMTYSHALCKPGRDPG